MIAECGCGVFAYPERHHEGVQDNDKQKFEEVCGICCKTRHPICASCRISRRSTANERASGSHGPNNDVWNNPQRNRIEDESRQEPCRGTIIATGPFSEEEGSELHDIVQRAESRERN
jgi:hypothetical protein